MALKFGDQLTDVSTDEAALAEFLDLAREREKNAPEGDEEFTFADADPEFDADPDPGFQGEGAEDRIIPDTVFNPPKGRAVSARVQKDIQAKTALFLLAGGTAWKTRDEFCGGVFVDAIPDVSEKLTAIFCDSPDIVKWFTASGKYMKWLDLAMALQPIVSAVFAHHITHTVTAEGDESAPTDWSMYGTG